MAAGLLKRVVSKYVLTQSQNNMHRSEACTTASKTPRDMEKLDGKEEKSMFANSQDEERVR